MNTNNLKKIVKIRDTASQDVAVDNTLRKRKRRWYLIGGGAVALLLIALSIPALHRWARAEQTVSADQVRLAKVTRGTFVRDISVDGKVVAAVSPMLYSEVNGTVTLKVNAGDTVKKSQILAVIDSPELSSKFNQENSTLSSMQIDLERERINAKKAALKSQETVDLAGVKLEAAQREMKRADSAWGFHVISEQDYEKAKDDLAAAKLGYNHALADTKLDKEGLSFDVRTKELQAKRQRLLVQDLQRQVDNLNVRSPVNGIVGNLSVQQKANVTPNQPLLSVVDLSKLEIEIEIPESYADSLAIGMDSQITYGSSTYKGVLAAVSPEVQSNQVVGRVRFASEEPKGLKQNQQVQVRILIDSRPDVLMVQRGPFLDSGGGRVAYVLHDGIATRTPITTGASSISQVEILGGLKQGDTVIISDTSSFDSANTVYINN
ncbi:MAG: efflux RND transporter periplasmic adaptor subunit [Gammaproteobacteria bacterium]